MDWEILAYIFTPLMIVLAFVAYRYWNATASYALRMRESHARALKPPADASAPGSPDPDEAADASPAAGSEEPGTVASDGTLENASENQTKQREESGGPKEAEDALHDRPKHNDSGQIGRVADPITALIKDLDEQLASLPSGIELIDLPILEKRRIADRRDELLGERERLLGQKKRGAHRHRRRSWAKNR